MCLVIYIGERRLGFVSNARKVIQFLYWVVLDMYIGERRLGLIPYKKESSIVLDFLWSCILMKVRLGFVSVREKVQCLH